MIEVRIAPVVGTTVCDMLHRGHHPDALGAHRAAIRALESAVARARVAHEAAATSGTTRRSMRRRTVGVRPLLDARR